MLAGKESFTENIEKSDDGDDTCLPKEELRAGARARERRKAEQLSRKDSGVMWEEDEDEVEVLIFLEEAVVQLTWWRKHLFFILRLLSHEWGASEQPIPMTLFMPGILEGFGPKWALHIADVILSMGESGCPQVAI